MKQIFQQQFISSAYFDICRFFSYISITIHNFKKAYVEKGIRKSQIHKCVANSSRTNIRTCTTINEDK